MQQLCAEMMSWVRPRVGLIVHQKFSAKGQLISKWFFEMVDFLQKTNKTIRLLVKMNSFVRFLEEIDDPINHFEINLPLYIFKVHIYFEKATKFCKVSNLLLTVYTAVKSKVEISKNLVAFSEYMNFNKLSWCLVIVQHQD